MIGLVVSLVIALSAAPRAEALLGLMGASPEVIHTGSGFTRVMMGGNVTVVLLFLINAVFRGSGDAAIAMRVLWLGNFLNLILGPCFIFGLGPFPELGVMGAAVATNIGRGTAVLYQLVVLSRGNGRVKITARDLAIDLSIMRSVLRLSGSGTFQILIGTASYVGLVRILSAFGSSALAGYTIGIRVIVFALLPAFGISNASATMVGQNLGAGRPDRAEQSAWTAARYNMLFLGSVGVVFLLAARQIAGVFSQDPVVRVLRHRLPADRQPRVRVLCLRDGVDSGIQRGGGHMDANRDQPLRFLALGDPSGLVSLLTGGYGRPRGVRGSGGGLFDARRGQRRDLPAGALEAQASLIRRRVETVK